MTYPEEIHPELKDDVKAEAEDDDLLTQNKLTAEDQVGFARKVLGIVAA